ncbi:peptidase, partial [Pseudoalteromonas sp. S1609]
EGHGALINQRWVGTVAHTIFKKYTRKTLKRGANTYKN